MKISNRTRDAILTGLVAADAAVNAWFWYRLRPGARNWLFETNRQAMHRRLKACEDSVQTLHDRCNDNNSDLNNHIADGHPSGLIQDPLPEQEK